MHSSGEAERVPLAHIVRGVRRLFGVPPLSKPLRHLFIYEAMGGATVKVRFRDFSPKEHMGEQHVVSANAAD